MEVICYQITGLEISSKLLPPSGKHKHTRTHAH